MKISTSKKTITSPALISMTDVIFLLLIFLLISSNFTSQTGLPVKLPGSSTATRQTNQVINLVYPGGDKIMIDGKSVKLEDLGENLKTLFKNKTQIVKLATDKKTQIQDVIDIMDVIRMSGFERIFVATDIKKR